jgi:hypothetical protein
MALCPPRSKSQAGVLFLPRIIENQGPKDPWKSFSLASYAKAYKNTGLERGMTCSGLLKSQNGDHVSGLPLYDVLFPLDDVLSK